MSEALLHFVQVFLNSRLLFLVSKVRAYLLFRQLTRIESEPEESETVVKMVIVGVGVGRRRYDQVHRSRFDDIALPQVRSQELRFAKLQKRAEVTNLLQ